MRTANNPTALSVPGGKRPPALHFVVAVGGPVCYVSASADDFAHRSLPSSWRWSAEI